MTEQNRLFVKEMSVKCKFCLEEFDNIEDLEQSEEHLCISCGNRIDYEHCEKLDGSCIECYEE